MIIRRIAINVLRVVDRAFGATLFAIVVSVLLVRLSFDWLVKRLHLTRQLKS